jgi:NTP pyrophosphatase (non-canonical NTP hydrolase)
MRFLEEALELAQAVGLTEAEIDKVKTHVYAKSVGRVEQEIGGVVSTLLTLAQAHGVSMNEAALAELKRGMKI